MYMVRQGSRTDYNYKEYYLDDVSELPLILEKEGDEICPGSIAFIINTSDVYCLNSNME